MIYIDDNKPPCHLFSDSVDLNELHKFAVTILDFKLIWFQGRGTYPHYDILVKTKIRVAIKNGAKVVTRKKCIKILLNTWPNNSYAEIRKMYKLQSTEIIEMNERKTNKWLNKLNG